MGDRETTRRITGAAYTGLVGSWIAVRTNRTFVGAGIDLQVLDIRIKVDLRAAHRYTELLGSGGADGPDILFAKIQGFIVVLRVHESRQGELLAVGRARGDA